MSALEILGRYLNGQKQFVYRFPWHDERELGIYSDTDWAACKSTRRSTSGGVVMHGAHLLRSWSRQQTLIALFSAEGELYGTVRASCELLGCRSLARDY